MKTTLFAKYLAVVLTVGLAYFSGNAEAGIVTLDAPFTVNKNDVKYINFNGTSLVGSTSRGSNSATFGNDGIFRFAADWINSSTYAKDNNILTYSYESVGSASSAFFSFGFDNFAYPSDVGLTYYVLAFYNNVNVNSAPPTPDPNFVAGSNIAWIAAYRTGSGNSTAFVVQSAGINTVAGGSVIVGTTVDPSQVPEIDPATGSSALSLVAGVLAMIERQRRKTTAPLSA